MMTHNDDDGDDDDEVGDGDWWKMSPSGKCTRSVQPSDKPALLDQQQDQWSYLRKMILLFQIILAQNDWE